MAAPMEKPRILCVGLACVDIVNVVAAFPLEDSDQRCLEQYWQKGGNAANTSSVLGLLDVNVECMASFAKSYELGFLTDEFKSYGVNIDHCSYHSNCTTPTSCIIINAQNGSRTITHGNKNLPEISFEDFSQLDLKQYKWIHFEGRPNVTEMIKMLASIDEYNKTVDINQRITTSVELEKARKGLVRFLDKADYVFASKEFSGCHGYTSKEEAVDKFGIHIRDDATLIIPWGEDGAIAKPKNGDVVKSPIFPPDKVVDTLGAGDSFIAGTLCSLLAKKSLQDSIIYGCKVAGAKVGMRGFRGLETFSHEC